MSREQIRHRSRHDIELRGRRIALHGLAVAVLVAGAGLIWVELRPDSVRQDLLGDFSRLGYWWRHPFIAAGLTGALTIAASLLLRPTTGGESRFPARLGAVAAGTWLLLTMVFWGSVVAAQWARRDYERDTRAAYDDTIGALAGPDAERWLDRLRHWEP